MRRLAAQVCWREAAARAVPREYSSVDRLLLLRWLVLAGGMVVISRVVALELAYGARFRRMAARPVVSAQPAVATRPRILARDGSVLAADRVVPALAVHYRYLEDPPHEGWLAARARARLPPALRRQRSAVAAEVARLRQQHVQVRAALARACGMTLHEFAARAAVIQRRIQTMRQAVQAQRQPVPAPLAADTPFRGGKMLAWLSALWHLHDETAEQSAASLPLAEELWYHPICVGLSLESVAGIEAHPDRYPGALVLGAARREYPRGASMAHVVGEIAGSLPAAPARGAALAPLPVASRGTRGAERLLDALLARDRAAATAGGARRGEPPAAAGGEQSADLVLTLDPRLQQRAHDLLEAASRRRTGSGPTGGALVLAEAATGEILALASWPTFEPGRRPEGRGEIGRAAAVVPLDRSLRAARPGGMVLAPVLLIAALEAGQADERELVRALRAGRLAELCGASQADCVLRWAARCGLGAATGIELPGEAAGVLPLPAGDVSGRHGAWRIARALAEGQRPVAVTPLQVARLMCACANDGRLVRLHVVRNAGWLEMPEHSRGRAADSGPSGPGAILSEQAAVLPAQTVAAVRRVLRQAAKESVSPVDGEMELVCLASRPPAGRGCMWLAGYAPALRPRVAFALMLEQDETPEAALRRWLHELCAAALEALRREQGL
jgi:penicillin-binding protein 2